VPTVTGTAHPHAHPNILPVEGSAFGAGRSVDMTPAASLLGARLDGCRECQTSLTTAVIAGDPLVLAALARQIYGARPSASPHASAPTRMIRSAFCESAGRGLGTPDEVALDAITSMTRPQRADLLEDTLGEWATSITQDEVQLGVPRQEMIISLTPEPAE
jgi:hypothetical protein